MKIGQRVKRFWENFKEAMVIVEDAMEEEFERDIDFFEQKTFKNSNITTVPEKDEK